MAGFRVDRIDPVTITTPNRLAGMYVLSPFVWRDGATFRLLVRAVPMRDDEPRLKMAEAWYGRSDDGLQFDMDPAPVIFPGPDQSDIDGCEDPTVIVDQGTLRVWYTGWNQAERTGRLLLARGPDVAHLEKVGVALDSCAPFTNPKEATVVADGDQGWRLFFEYADADASLIGNGSSAALDGPWAAIKQSAIRPRPDQWDAWHLSPGPIVGAGTDRPVMFYNGATRDAKWRVGWAAFDPELSRIVDRCDDPLIVPDAAQGDATDIAFAASAVEQDGRIALYYSLSDRALRRAIIVPA